MSMLDSRPPVDARRLARLRSITGAISDDDALDQAIKLFESDPGYCSENRSLEADAFDRDQIVLYEELVNAGGISLPDKATFLANQRRIQRQGLSFIGIAKGPRDLASNPEKYLVGFGE